MTTTADTILAIDLGRFKSVACVYSRSTRNHAFRTIDSKPDALAQLLAEHPGSLVVIEACANAGWVHDQAVAAGHTVKVANTAAEAWKFQHLKRKTDHDDAKRLAELEAIGQLPTVVLPTPAVALHSAAATRRRSAMKARRRRSTCRRRRSTMRSRRSARVCLAVAVAAGCSAVAVGEAVFWAAWQRLLPVLQAALSCSRASRT